MSRLEAQPGLIESQATLRPEESFMGSDVDLDRPLSNSETEQHYQAYDAFPVPIVVFGHKLHKPLEYKNSAYRHLKPEYIGSISNLVTLPLFETEKGVLTALQMVQIHKDPQATKIHISGGPSYELTAFRVTGPDGETNAAITLHDITEYKLQIEEARRIQKAEDMRFTQDGQTFAHDLKNPLGAVYGFNTYAQRELEKPEPRLKSIAEALTAINQAYEKCMYIVVEKIEMLGGSSELERKILSIADVLNKVNNDYSHRMETSGTRINLHLPPADLELVGDAEKLASAIEYIIGNSHDAMAGCEDKEFTEEYEIKNNQITLFFTDTGCGIPKQDQPKIFKSDFSTKRGTDQHGTGIGLYMAREIVQQHGGDVKLVKSVTQEMLLADPKLKQIGSTFSVSLPLLQQKS